MYPLQLYHSLLLCNRVTKNGLPRVIGNTNLKSSLHSISCGVRGKSLLWGRRCHYLSQTIFRTNFTDIDYLKIPILLSHPPLMSKSFKISLSSHRLIYGSSIWLSFYRLIIMRCWQKFKMWSTPKHVDEMDVDDPGTTCPSVSSVLFFFRLRL